jgi:uncharacterized membrane protein YphA (DoxX/SURF4 family)
MGFLKSRVFRFIASLGLALLFYFLCPPCFSKMYLGGVLLLLVLIINLPTIFGNKWLTHLTRLAVGGLFIFSGFIKANDPVGFSYKLEEYFDVFGQGFSCDMKVVSDGKTGIPCEDEAFRNEQEKKKQAALEAKRAIDPNYVEPQPPTPPVSSFKPLWEFFAHHSLFFAIFICGFEIALGIFLLLGLQVRWTLFLLLAMIVFFSFLTFYSACCNKVTSCGCFGDAIKLTPWESFWKDLILLILIAVLYVGEQHIKPLFKNTIVMAGIAGIGLFASFAFPVYTWRHMPVIDFRPYAIGTNLYEASKNKDPKITGCTTDSVAYYFYYKKIGSNIIDTIGPGEDFPDSTWDYYCRYDKKIRTGNCKATVLDFHLGDPESGADYTDSILQMKGVQFFLVMYDLSKTDYSVMPQVNKFYEAAAKNGTPFNGLSNVQMDSVMVYRTKTKASYPMLTVDGTALKTVLRSNPGLVMLKDGVVVGMWHSNDFPEYSEAMKK